MKYTDSRALRAGDPAIQARFGGCVASHLGQGVQHLPRDIEERLRSGREQALARARQTLVAHAGRAGAVAMGGGTVALGGGAGWSRWAGGLLPLALLLGGLLAIGQFAAQQNAEVAADIDAQLLSDNLPPSAYADPGFAAFLRAGDADR